MMSHNNLQVNIYTKKIFIINIAYCDNKTFAFNFDTIIMKWENHVKITNFCLFFHYKGNLAIIILYNNGRYFLIR